LLSAVGPLRAATALLLEAEPAAAVLLGALDDRLLLALRAGPVGGPVAVLGLVAVAAPDALRDDRPGVALDDLRPEGVVKEPLVEVLDLAHELEARRGPEQVQELLGAGLEEGWVGDLVPILVLLLGARDRPVVHALNHVVADVLRDDGSLLFGDGQH